ncbi:MAG: hypothetical protein HY320_08915 [Armatimonadetes bacterium]|nr:hypothetical protein [Armatimonadota bacterium]
MLRHREAVESEPRYDAATLQKVAALAARLQSRHEETLTAQEMESIGAEVGLEPAFIRQALWQLTREKRPASLRPQNLRAIARAWWGAGWAIPFIGLLLLDALGLHELLPAIGFFLGWALYIGGGILLGSWSAGPPETVDDQPVSRATLVDALFTLQHDLEGQKVHRASLSMKVAGSWGTWGTLSTPTTAQRAFLSVDFVGASEMKRGAPELAVEYPFGPFQAWVEEIVRGCGGEMQSATGDGIMSIFPDDTSAVRAARQLQERLGQFNAAHNRLPNPFQIRCGVSAGEIAFKAGTLWDRLNNPVIDRAVALQKRAAPGDIVVGSEVAGAALLELGNLSPLPERIAGEPAFSWRAGAP